MGSPPWTSCVGSMVSFYIFARRPRHSPDDAKDLTKVFSSTTLGKLLQLPAQMILHQFHGLAIRDPLQELAMVRSWSSRSLVAMPREWM